MKKLLLLFTLLPFLCLSQVQIGQDIDGEAPGDGSGRSVSLSSDGTTVAIGATGNDGNGSGFETNYGHVRVYKNQSGVWTQIGSDIDGEAAHNQSGSSVSLSSDGTIVAIGARTNSDNGASSGHVRVYENQGGTWVQIGQDIDGEAANDSSGRSVSLSSDGSVVAIGAPFNDGNGGGSGHVRVYENQSGVWTQIGNDIDGESSGDYSGASISLSSDGSIVAIGAPGNNENGEDSGHVRVYENQSGAWVQIGADIDGEGVGDSSAGGEFSYSTVSLSSDGSIVAIGEPFSNPSNSGHVRVFENVSGVWTQIGNDINAETADEQSGWSVSLSSDGSIVAIGAIENEEDNVIAGHTRIYKNISGVWTQIGTDIDGEADDDQSGWSVSLSSDGSVVAISAPRNDGNGDTSGHVRFFSIASELALLEVVEDIAGNSNGINITAEQLNAIEGVSGAINGVNYTTALQNGSYVDSNNPTALEIQTIVNQVNANLSIDENNLLSFRIYPNPTKNQFTIQIVNNTGLQNVNIYNNLGQQILTSKDYVVDTSKLASGLYTVEIETTKGKGSKKLIIE